MHERLSASDLATFQAVNRERHLIAQELHDTICQSLVGISLMINVLNRRVAKGQPLAVDELDCLGAMVNHVIDEAHSLKAKMTGSE
ncbi:MAG: Histidine kinase [Chthoniobacteraceae bacterium]|nr:Histidine kinase [Chthoniobacteraceae bacterium]